MIASEQTIDFEAPVATELNAFDRCDACGAQAYIRAQIGGSELFFCAHHGRKHEEKLSAIATDWHDESARLNEKK